MKLRERGARAVVIGLLAIATVLPTAAQQLADRAKEKSGGKGGTAGMTSGPSADRAVNPPSEASSRARQLPRTASPYPAIGVLGLAALGLSFSLRLMRRR